MVGKKHKNKHKNKEKSEEKQKEGKDRGRDTEKHKEKKEKRRYLHCFFGIFCKTNVATGNLLRFNVTHVLLRYFQCMILNLFLIVETVQIVPTKPSGL